MKNHRPPKKRLKLHLFGITLKLPNPLWKIQEKCFLESQIEEQNKFDLTYFLNSPKQLIVFVLPGEIVISGGILSIFSLCKYTKEILQDSDVLLVTEPGNLTYAQLNWFKNHEKILRWEQIAEILPTKREVVLHVPEYLAGIFADRLTINWKAEHLKNTKLTINILNQNPLLLPGSEVVSKLTLFTRNITQTLAFRDSNVEEIGRAYRTPVKFISSYVDLSDWKPVSFIEKNKTILLSPDKNRYSSALIRELKTKLPDFNVSVIQDFTFEDYMKEVTSAFAVITLGEGFDGYLLQAASVKTLSFAVYNEVFFPNEEFLALPNIYRSYPELLERITNDIIEYQYDSSRYYKTIEELRALDREHSEEFVKENLLKYYRRDFDCLP